VRVVQKSHLTKVDGEMTDRRPPARIEMESISCWSGKGVSGSTAFVSSCLAKQLGDKVRWAEDESIGRETCVQLGCREAARVLRRTTMGQ